MIPDQIPLNLPHDASFAAEDYIISASNKSAYDTVMSWPEWSAHAMMLIGPKASGKSHLASIWANKVGALIIDGDLLHENDVQHVHSNIVYEIADPTLIDHALLFHLYNWTKEHGLHLLIVADRNIDTWDIKLADLTSRLSSLPCAQIAHPDDQQLAILLQKLFSDRQQIVSLSVLNYLVPRIERSFEAILHLVEKIDQTALAKKSKITTPLVRGCIQTLDSE